MNPYDDKPDFQFHNRIIRETAPSSFDPIVSTKFLISESDNVMTVGSCFAQHLSRWLLTNTANMFVNEEDEFGGGIFFSGNYGNVYSALQLLQLFDRAFGSYETSNEVATDNRGRYFDPIRPSIMPRGLASKELVLSSRSAHLAKVRQLFLNADVLVFTLGLTEMWIRQSDNAALPSAPGVIAGEFDSKLTTFHNATYEDVYESLNTFVQNLEKVNPNCRVLLSVSPVPLAATFETKHVAVASMASKAILRASAQKIVDQYSNVDYFPSFEIFYTPGIGDYYFSEDLRHVEQAGVEHAMRLFKTHYLDGGDSRAPSSKDDRKAAVTNLISQYGDVVCDEDKI